MSDGHVSTVSTVLAGVNEVHRQREEEQEPRARVREGHEHDPLHQLHRLHSLDGLGGLDRLYSGIGEFIVGVHHVFITATALTGCS